jgi:hypothetical protein
VRKAQLASEGTSVEVVLVCMQADEAAKKPCEPVVARLTGTYMGEAEMNRHKVIPRIC